MPIWFKAAGKWGIIFVILGLIVTLLKQVIAFIGFLTGAIKILVVLVFAALFLFVALLVFRAWQDNRRKREKTS